ncbi:MAG: AAA family ATPase [Lachnospiraceae bacterium]|nr:AAA family ATPase [Lachnospiraceae bacterium]
MEKTEKDIRFDGELFLEDVIKKLHEKMDALKKDLSAGEDEIRQMHDYYWENYTEMDQYGYEDYDNQQALLGQVKANQEKLRMQQRIAKLMDAPFFGRVDFVYDGEDEPEVFYIGIGNFAPEAGMCPLIYDWRAPVCSLFYDYDAGEASYEAPSGMITGKILSKWQYKIRDGKMIYAFESDTKIDDEILKQELGSNSDVQLKNIVRTIQKEQNEIIRNRKDPILVIQGVAGSGKTSVALHRVAYLLYHDREHLKASNVLILSPNGVFSDYISHILPELGEENIREMSFYLFAYKELHAIVNDCEDRYDELERQMRFPDKAAKMQYERKQSSDMIGLMEAFLAVSEEELVDLKEISYKGFVKSESEVISLFYFKFQNTPLLARMDAVMDYYKDELVTLRGRELSEEEEEYLQEKTREMYTECDIYHIYNRFLEFSGFEPLEDVSYEKRILPYEDVFPMLYLKYRLLGTKQHKNVKHLVIDEMQDYSYLQYNILSMLFPCRMTILGDKLQTMDEKCQDVTKFLPHIFDRKVRILEMNKSYRNTVEIAEYARALSNDTALELLKRHGQGVIEIRFDDADDLIEQIVKKADLDHYETAAILTLTEEDALYVCKLLEKRKKEYHYIDRNTSAFEKGLTVTTFYLAKGLEFDQVFTAFFNMKNPLLKQAAYISATRALHELYVYELEDK